MRAALTALTDELKRLKSTGVTSVSVSAESIETLRKVIAQHAGTSADGRPAESVVRENHAPVARPREAKEPVRPSTTVAATKEKPEAPRMLPPPPVVTLPEGDKATRWAWLRDLVLTHPVCAANVRPGKKVVLGVGSLDAKVMFVGEAPGAEEEVRGEPFVGPAGQLLTKMILGMGVKREDVYIGNIMNWRPQIPTPEGMEQVGNRAPTPEEM